MNKLNPKLILFDFDGTIADTFDLSIQIIENFSKELALKLTHKEIIDLIQNHSIKDIIKKIKINKFKLIYYLFKGKLVLRKIIKKAKTFEDVEETLSELKKRNYKLAILSSNSKKNIKIFLEKENLNEYFDFIETKFSLETKERVFKNILHKNNFKNEDIIYIGDEIRDLEASKKANIECIILNYGFNSKKLIDTKNPRYEISKFKNILNIVN